MTGITWLHLTVLVLATFRLTHLIVYDEITSFLRKPFLLVEYETDESGQTYRHEGIRGTGWRYAVGLMLSCHWCVGVWSALGLTVLYLWLPASFPFHLILAVAGAAALLEEWISQG